MNHLMFSLFYQHIQPFAQICSQHVHEAKPRNQLASVKFEILQGYKKNHIPYLQLARRHTWLLKNKNWICINVTISLVAGVRACMILTWHNGLVFLSKYSPNSRAVYTMLPIPKAERKSFFNAITESVWCHFSLMMFQKVFGTVWKLCRNTTKHHYSLLKKNKFMKYMEETSGIGTTKINQTYA